MSPGLGLGLTIPRLLTETLGGEIRVESKPGEGALFTVRLMLAKIDRPATLGTANRHVTGYRGERRVVMVVDDNADHREMMRQMLQPLGFTVLTAADGAECLALTTTAKPDLFFVDIQMPGMSGWTLVERLRERGLAAPIVMLSANIGDGVGKPARDAGHDALMTKPFDLRQLLQVMGAQLKLEWTEEGEGAERASAAAQATTLLSSPGSNHVAELLRLGRIGHVRGIDRKLTELSQEPDNQVLVERLRAHMDVYDFEGYAKLLESVRGDE